MAEVVHIEIPENMVLGRQLCFAIHAASNLIGDLYRPLLAEHGLTYAQYTTLMALAEKDDVSITYLARRLGVTKATMTPLLRRLEERNLVSRKVEDGNERQKAVTITIMGRELLGSSCKVTDAVFRKTNLTQDQATELIALCKLITADIEQGDASSSS